MQIIFIIADLTSVIHAGMVQRLGKSTVFSNCVLPCHFLQLICGSGNTWQSRN